MRAMLRVLCAIRRINIAERLLHGTVGLSVCPVEASVSYRKHLQL